MKTKSRLVFTKEQLEQTACASLNKSTIANIDKAVQRYHFFVGIDAGTHTGIAFWDAINKKFIWLETLPIHVAMERVKYWLAANQNLIFICCEDARQATYGRQGKADKAKEQGAGSIKRDCAIWDAYLEYLGAHYEMVRPSKAHTKWDADKFNKITGFTGRTSQHARDAATMVFGLQPNYIQTKK